MAIKEEQYDPGYEDAYGGAYAEGGAQEGRSQLNGHCTFSGEASGGVITRGGGLRGRWPGVVSVCRLSADGPQKDGVSPAAVGGVPDGRWLTQSFTDQIPDIGGGQRGGGE